MGVIGSPMCAGKAHLIAFLITIIKGWHYRGSPAWLTYHYAKYNTPLLVKIYPKSNKRKNSVAGIYRRLGKICIFLLPSLARKPH
jgi:hypothetical protein